MDQYRNFDMTSLKQEIERTFVQESRKIEQDYQSKQQEIQTKFKQVQRLSQAHIGHDKYTTGNNLDEQLINQYEEVSSTFQAAVSKANVQKQQLREEIIQIETEMRQQRDQLADKQAQNRAMQFILSKEEQLSERKSVVEHKALQLLKQDI